MKAKVLFIWLLLCTGCSCHQKISSKNTAVRSIVLGGGCYWCVEAIYQRMEGVVTVTSGFSGGDLVNPTYEEVSYGNTGHAEVVKIDYDENKISLPQLLKVFFKVHDPTSLNQQGADVGAQYRSVIFYSDSNQLLISKKIIDSLNKSAVFNNPIVTTLQPFKAFYKAPIEHQNYYNSNKSKPYCKLVIQPKVEKFEKVFSEFLKKQ